MESSNFHQHQLQEQFLDHQTLYGSSTTTSVGHGSNNSSSSSAWNPNQLILNNGGNFNLTNSSRDGENIDHIHLVPPPSLNTTSMFQDLGFHCINTSNTTTTSFTNTQSAAHELHLAKIKKESSSSHHHFKNQEQQQQQFNYIKQLHHDHEQVLLQQDLSEHEQQKLLLKSYSSSDLYSNNHTFTSQIFPSTNISNLLMNNSASSPTSFSSSLGMNFQALDLLSSGSFGSSQPTSQNNNNNHLGLSFDLDHLQGISSSSSSTTLWPSNNNKMSSLFMNGGARGTETKRSSNALEEYSSSTSSKGTPPHHTVVVPKKPRMESRSSSFPPFKVCPPNITSIIYSTSTTITISAKVRKEKLGDRIATLQQLVAPFGKTDTASVLMEAIGYIKFLHDQVETLSVPYMKSVRNHSRIIVHRGSSTTDIQEGNKEAKQQRDLRSRGLCLVPLTFTSYISGVDNLSIGAIWPPLPNYSGGGT